MKRILTVFGTRPEAIKLAPVILELRDHFSELECIVCITAQHREMLDQVLDWFNICPQYDLDLMQPNQHLAEFSGKALTAVSKVIKTVKPDVVIVQGDTTTVMVTALAAFYEKIPVAHVEAGLRTNDRFNPFPEELNRRMASLLAALHFAPTRRAAAALRGERIKRDNIYVTGNTVVDALLMTLRRKVEIDLNLNLQGRRLILVTAHRRESFGAPFESLCGALKDIAEQHQDVVIVYPVHLNPNVREPVNRILSNHPRIRLIEPLRYEQFCHLMAQAYLILTDSGGIQEEAPVLGKPTLVMRRTTERPEALEIGATRLVGTNRAKIVKEVDRLLSDVNAYQKMSTSGSPYGDGLAAKRIVAVLKDRFVKSGDLYKTNPMDLETSVP